MGAFSHEGVREGFSEEVTLELRPQVAESEGAHQAEGTASVKVLGFVVVSSTATNGKNNDGGAPGAGKERMRSEGVGRGHITPGLAGLCKEAGFG